MPEGPVHSLRTDILASRTKAMPSREAVTMDADECFTPPPGSDLVNFYTEQARAKFRAHLPVSPISGMETKQYLAEQGATDRRIDDCIVMMQRMLHECRQALVQPVEAPSASRGSETSLDLEHQEVVAPVTLQRARLTSNDPKRIAMTTDWVMASSSTSKDKAEPSAIALRTSSALDDHQLAAVHPDDSTSQARERGRLHEGPAPPETRKYPAAALPGSKIATHKPGPDRRESHAPAEITLLRNLFSLEVRWAW